MSPSKKGSEEPRAPSRPPIIPGIPRQPFAPGYRPVVTEAPPAPVPDGTIIIDDPHKRPTVRP